MKQFYIPNVDITKDKSMFNFIAGHPTRHTQSRPRPAHNMKVYKLELTNPYAALQYLYYTEYMDINYMIEEWERANPDYEIFVDGRSSGYIVLGFKSPTEREFFTSITACRDYNDYKAYCREYGTSCKDFRPLLQKITVALRRFDKLCDELTAYCEDAGAVDLTEEIVARAVEDFEDTYANLLRLADTSIESIDVEDGDYIVQFSAEVVEVPELLQMFKNRLPADFVDAEIIYSDETHTRSAIKVTRK